MTELFRCHGRTLQSLVSLAKAADVVEFSFVAHDKEIRLMATDKIRYISAVLAIAQGPAEPVETRHDVRAFADVIKPFLKEPNVAVSVEGVSLTLKAGRKVRKASMMGNHGDSFVAPTYIPPARAILPVAWVRSLLSDGSSIDTDIVVLSIGNGGVNGKLEGKNESHEDALEVVSEGDPCVAMYTTDAVRDLLAPAQSDTVVFRIGQDAPLRMEFAVEDGVATVWLAPRVRPEE